MTEVATVTERAGKYLTFVLAGEDYGLEILKVREIMGILDITTVPHTPVYVKGVVNIRGKVIPIVDLRLKFDIAETEYTEQTCIIVVYVGQVEVGIIVDCVSEVMDIKEEDIEDSPEFGADVDTHTILGMSKAGGKVTILLDINKVLGSDDVTAIQDCV